MSDYVTQYSSRRMLNAAKQKECMRARRLKIFANACQDGSDVLVRQVNCEQRRYVSRETRADVSHHRWHGADCGRNGLVVAQETVPRRHRHHLQLHTTRRSCSAFAYARAVCCWYGDIRSSHSTLSMLQACRSSPSSAFSST